MDNNSFGNFEFVLDSEGNPHLLGKGTFGSTFLARHRFLDTPAALKVINEGIALNATARTRFLSEAKAVARLNHEHIARIQDFGENNGVLFYAMEYCAGGHLQQYIQAHGALLNTAWLEVARQTTKALICCHGAGFIHRDLKPSNLMLAAKEGPMVVKIIDFGLVHSDNEGSRKENPEIGLGSLLYASPEQLREQSIDVRSDLFSLGMTLWHLAKGYPPDSGANSDILERRLDSLSYAQELPLELAEPLRNVLALLIEKDPSKRPQSAANLLQLLNDAERQLVENPQEPPSSNALINHFPVEKKDQKLESEFQIIQSIGDHGLGSNYLADQKTDPKQRVWLHTIQLATEPESETLSTLIVNCKTIRELDFAELLLPLKAIQYKDHTAVICTPPSGNSLLTELKTIGKVPLKAINHFLAKVASITDRLADLGLPIPELRPATLFCTQNSLRTGIAQGLQMMPRFLNSSGTDSSGGSNSLLDASATITPEIFDEASHSGSPVVPFCRLIYRIAAGRDCPTAAGVSMQAYIAIPELSEEGNRFLAQIIAGKASVHSCSQLFSKLLEAEGIDFSKAPPPPAPLPSQSPSNSVTPAVTNRILKQPLSKESKEPVPRQLKTAPTETPLLESTPTPSKPPHSVATGNRKGVILLTASILILLFAGLSLLMSLRGTKPAVVPSTLHLSGEIPQHSRLKLDQMALSPTFVDGTASLPLPKDQKLPFQLTFDADGYDSKTLKISNWEQLSNPIDLAPQRSQGTLVLKPQKRCDYDYVSWEMESLLPEESQFGIPLDRGSGAPFKELSDNRIELPTGIYTVKLIGSPSVTSIFTIHNRVTIRKSEEATVLLPPSYLGQFKGSSQQGVAEIRIDTEARDTRTGLSFNSEGFCQFEYSAGKLSGKVSKMKLDEKGCLNAEFRDAAGGHSWDLRALLSSDGNTLELTLHSRAPLAQPVSFKLLRKLDN